MKQVYFVEELPPGDVVKIQNEVAELAWAYRRIGIPHDSELARRQWCKDAEGWLRQKCKRGWIALAYLRDSFLYINFENEADVEPFMLASRSLF